MACVLQTAKLRCDANIVTGKNTKRDANYHSMTKLSTSATSSKDRCGCFKEMHWTPVTY